MDKKVVLFNGPAMGYIFSNREIKPHLDVGFGYNWYSDITGAIVEPDDYEAAIVYVADAGVTFCKIEEESGKVVCGRAHIDQSEICYHTGYETIEDLYSAYVADESGEVFDKLLKFVMNNNGFCASYAVNTHYYNGNNAKRLTEFLYAMPDEYIVTNNDHEYHIDHFSDKCKYDPEVMAIFTPDENGKIRYASFDLNNDRDHWNSIYIDMHVCDMNALKETETEMRIEVSDKQTTKYQEIDEFKKSLVEVWAYSQSHKLNETSDDDWMDNLENAFLTFIEDVPLTFDVSIYVNKSVNDILSHRLLIE